MQWNLSFGHLTSTVTIAHSKMISYSKINMIY